MKKQVTLSFLNAWEMVGVVEKEKDLFVYIPSSSIDLFRRNWWEEKWEWNSYRNGGLNFHKWNDLKGTGVSHPYLYLSFPGYHQAHASFYTIFSILSLNASVFLHLEIWLFAFSYLATLAVSNEIKSTNK